MRLPKKMPASGMKRRRKKIRGKKFKKCFMNTTSDQICRNVLSKRAHLLKKLEEPKEEEKSEHQEYSLITDTSKKSQHQYLLTLDETSPVVFEVMKGFSEDPWEEVPGLGMGISVARGVVLDDEFVLLDSGFLIGSDTQDYLPVVDSQGCLVGEFDELDDSLWLTDVFSSSYC